MPIDLAELKAKLVALQTGQTTNTDYLDKYVILPEGETTVRMLPGRGTTPFYSETAVHRINGKTLHCPGRKICPICRLVSIQYNSKDDENIKLARQIKSRKRYYFNVIIRHYENPVTGKTETNVGPRVLACGIKLFEKILSTFVDEDYGDLTDLATGWDFKIIKKEKDGYPNYDDSRPRPKATPACNNLGDVKGWMDDLHDLQAIIVYRTMEELVAELKIFGFDVEVETPPVGDQPLAKDDIEDFREEIEKLRKVQ